MVSPGSFRRLLPFTFSPSLEAPELKELISKDLLQKRQRSPYGS